MKVAADLKLGERMTQGEKDIVSQYCDHDDVDDDHRVNDGDNYDENHTRGNIINNFYHDNDYEDVDDPHRHDVLYD